MTVGVVGLCTLLTPGEDMSDERFTAGLIGDGDAMSDLSGKNKKVCWMSEFEELQNFKS